VAHSPEENAPTTEVIRYDLGWNAINAMLRAGRSLSGHERNCCFLNGRGRRFADVSAVARLDFDDDGRVLALADWDYDGDVDFWIANRSGPQLRYLSNQLAPRSGFLAIRLQGVDCNRDAIGASVEVESVINGQPVTQSSTLKAGEGYLSQNSKWMHFGLGDAEEVKKLTVRWPNGNTQLFNNVQCNRWYQLVEREQLATWTPPELPPLQPRELVAPPVSDAARIVLLKPIPMPAISYRSVEGNSVQRVTQNSGVRLVNLWASWCQPCIKELAEWKQHADELESAGINVLAINVDEEGPSRSETVGAVLNALSLPFELGDGDEQLIEQFDVLQRSLLSRQRPLPIPSSFLVDATGRLCVVYKGPIEVATILNDARVLNASPDARLAAATPFAGKWLEPPGGSTQLHLAVKFLEGGLVEEAQNYIKSLIDAEANGSEDLSASLLNLYGATLLDQQEYAAAAKAFRRSLQLDPQNRQAHIELGTILLQSGRGPESRDHFMAVLRTNPSDPELQYKLGLAHASAGELQMARSAFETSWRLRPSSTAAWQLANVAVQLNDIQQAIASYEDAIRMNPKLLYQANNLAWLLATTEESGLRDGQRALEIAQEICSREEVDASSIDTLAAAYAAAGNYQAAWETAERASEVAIAEGNNELAARISARATLYKSGKPFRESP